jgi:hypothetical protein
MILYPEPPCNHRARQRPLASPRATGGLAFIGIVAASERRALAEVNAVDASTAFAPILLTELHRYIYLEFKLTFDLGQAI